MRIMGTLHGNKYAFFNHITLSSSQKETFSGKSRGETLNTLHFR